jgi:hypothetical protein
MHVGTCVNFLLVRCLSLGYWSRRACGPEQSRFHRGVNALRTRKQKKERKWCGQVSSLLLILSLLLPFAQLAFGSTDSIDAMVRACCRAHGKHQCAMRMSMRSSAGPSSPQLAQVTEKCPCTPGLAPATHSNPLWNHALGFSEFHVRDDRAPDAVNTRERDSSLEPANHKRGPPAFSENA